MEAAPPLPQNILELRLKTAAAAIRKPPPLLLCVLGEDEPICAAIEEFRTYIAGKGGEGEAGSRRRSQRVALTRLHNAK